VARPCSSSPSTVSRSCSWSPAIGLSLGRVIPASLQRTIRAGIALGLLDLKVIKVANFLPALVVAPLLAGVLQALGAV
jgi:hypothetical protein